MNLKLIFDLKVNENLQENWLQFKNDLSLKIKFGNILDGETVWFQQDEDHAIKKFKEGRNFSISASYKF